MKDTNFRGGNFKNFYYYNTVFPSIIVFLTNKFISITMESPVNSHHHSITFLGFQFVKDNSLFIIEVEIQYANVINHTRK